MVCSGDTFRFETKLMRSSQYIIYCTVQLVPTKPKPFSPNLLLAAVAPGTGGGGGGGEEEFDGEAAGDCGDSLVRRLCLDAVAVGENTAFGDVRRFFFILLLYV